MFQPIGPNFLLSYTMAWKKLNAKRSILYSFGFLQSLIILLSIEAHVLSMLDLKPVGGSMVIFTDVYRIDTGNAALGMEVNQILKSSWSLSDSCSTMASSLGIQETDK